MRVFVAAITVGLSALAHANAQPPSLGGTIAGCITDTIGQPLPGVTVDVSVQGVYRRFHSNTAGCYEFTDLPRGSYVLFATLPGFASVARDQIAIVPGRRESLSFQMRLHGICECVGPASTLASLWKEAEAIVRLRITAHQPGPTATPRGRPSCITHATTVVRVLKPHPRVASHAAALTFLQPTEPLYAEQEPYAIGQEFVIFLLWEPTHETFVRLDARLGGAAAFALENGRIRSAGIEGYAGKPVNELLTEIEALSRQ